jgi:hypothetical protein
MPSNLVVMWDAFYAQKSRETIQVYGIQDLSFSADLWRAVCDGDSWRLGEQLSSGGRRGVWKRLQLNSKHQNITYLAVVGSTETQLTRKLKGKCEDFTKMKGRKVS